LKKQKSACNRFLIPSRDTLFELDFTVVIVLIININIEWYRVTTYLQIKKIKMSVPILYIAVVTYSVVVVDIVGTHSSLCRGGWWWWLSLSHFFFLSFLSRLRITNGLCSFYLFHDNSLHFFFYFYIIHRSDTVVASVTVTIVSILSRPNCVWWRGGGSGGSDGGRRRGRLKIRNVLGEFPVSTFGSARPRIPGKSVSGLFVVNFPSHAYAAPSNSLGPG